MSTSSVNNGSQANSEIEVAAAVAVPQVHFAEEALVAGTSANPDGDRRRRRHHHRRTDQRATRRFQRATSIEVEFSNSFAVSPFASSGCGTCSDGFFQEARDTTDPYPSAQSLFARGGVEGSEDTFNDVFKKDLITISGMWGRRLMRRMRDRKSVV